MIMKDKKFEACFDNVKESIILISGGQIEYVNKQFLQNFEKQIVKCEIPGDKNEIKVKENWF